MTSDDINILCFTETNETLFASIKRYFNYILNQKLNPFSATESDASHKVLFVYQEEKENPKLLNIIVNERNINVVVIGYDSNSTINIVDLANLKNNFESELSNADFESHQLFTEEELREKLKNFFHSHGEYSLLEKLNWVNYYLSNGPRLLLQNEISSDDYQTKFLNLGKRYWQSFVKQVNQYKIYFQFLGLKDEIDEVINLQNKFIQFLIVIDNWSKNSETEINESLIQKNVDLLKKIMQILIKIKKDLEIGVPGLQNPGSRR